MTLSAICLQTVTLTDDSSLAVNVTYDDVWIDFVTETAWTLDVISEVEMVTDVTEMLYHACDATHETPISLTPLTLTGDLSTCSSSFIYIATLYSGICQHHPSSHNS